MICDVGAPRWPRLPRPGAWVTLLAMALGAVCGCDTEPQPEAYATYCAACHDTGAAGAPRRGDALAWEARLEVRSEEVMLRAVIDGIEGMPARGLCAACSDEELRELVRYVLR